jgi:hypothetical protein
MGNGKQALFGRQVISGVGEVTKYKGSVKGEFVKNSLLRALWAFRKL